MLGWLAYLTVAIVWGSTYFAIVLGLESFSAFGLVSIRFLSASAVAFAIGRLRREPWFSRQDLPHLFVVGFLLLCCSNFLITWSEEYVPSGVAAVLAAMTPIWLAVLNLRQQRLGVRGWCGLAIGIVGVAVLVLPSADFYIHFGGLMALLVAPFLWATGTLYGRRKIRSGGLFTNVSIEMATAAVVATIGASLSGGFMISELNWEAAAALFYLSVFGSVIAFSAYIYLSNTWDPARMGTYAYLNPVVAVILGTLLLGESFGIRKILGLFTILAAVALVQIRPKHHT